MFQLALVFALFLATLVKPIEPVQLIFRVGEVTDQTPKQAQVAVDMGKALDIGILVNLDGPGGSVAMGFEAVRILRQSDLPLTCIVTTESDSMDAWMLEMLPCHRQMLDSAIIVLHRPTIEEKDRLAIGITIETARQCEKDLTAAVCAITSISTHKRLGFDECVENLEKAPGNVLVFNAEHALKKGLIDEIVPTTTKP